MKHLILLVAALTALSAMASQECHLTPDSTVVSTGFINDWMNFHTSFQFASDAFTYGTNVNQTSCHRFDFDTKSIQTTIWDGSRGVLNAKMDCKSEMKTCLNEIDSSIKSLSALKTSGEPLSLDESQLVDKAIEQIQMFKSSI